MVYVRRAFHIQAFGACLIAATAFFCAPQDTHAQLSPVIDTTGTGVVVDMSVLEDRGIGHVSPGAQTPPLVHSGRGLLMPGKTIPKSQLHLKPAKARPAVGIKAPVLIPPTNVAAPKPKAPAKSRMVSAPPAAKPATPSMRQASVAPPPAAPAPKPIDQKIEPKVVAKAPPPRVAPPPAPKAKAAPPPPVLKAAPTPPKAPAPKVTKAPPPPPAKAAPEPMKLAKATATPIPKPEPMPAPKPEPVAEKAPPPPVAKPSTKVTVPLPNAPASPTETAARTPAGDVKSGDVVRVAFPAGQATLPADTEEALSQLATRLTQQKSLRLQLKAYAGGGDMSSSKARRLSLSRALSVRSYLIEKGVRSTRIDVRALGNKTTDEQVNRVDLNVIER